MADFEIHEIELELLRRRVRVLEEYIKANPRFIELEVYDKDNEVSHVIGTNQHDYLFVENGIVQYYNLQNGCGTPETYSFVEKEMP
jgi:hypothetical protein